MQPSFETHNNVQNWYMQFKLSIKHEMQWLLTELRHMSLVTGYELFTSGSPFLIQPGTIVTTSCLPSDSCLLTYVK